MKKLVYGLFILAFGLITTESYAYNVTTIQDSAVAGKGNANQVWYSLKNGTVKTTAVADWDLAFKTASRDAGIFINEGKGLMLWNVLGTTDEDFGNPVDTTGLAEDVNGAKFLQWHNSVYTWTIGAFNRGLDGFQNEGDYGCLLYHKATHTLTGTTVFVIKLADGSYKKIYIESLEGSNFTFVYSDLDGTNEETVVLNRVEHNDKLFAYFAFEGKTILDIEPPHLDWDMVFGSYEGLTPDQDNNLVYYPLSGVRTNEGVYVAEVETDNPLTADVPVINEMNYTDSITAIGSDWKSFNNTTFQYEIDNHRAYFVTRSDTDVANADVYRVIFTGYSGSSEGKYIFDPKPTSVLEAPRSTAKVGKNILSAGETVKINMNGEYAEGRLSVYMSNGRTVYAANVSGTNFEIPTFGLSTGMYFISLNVNGKVITGKFIIK